ncbi:MAG: hypothetical protein IJY59_06300 [Bacteroidaceae bacterium]|nr:hypothetical protein [Bacteroidaceae bacterium]
MKPRNIRLRDQLTERRQAVCELRMDADRILVKTTGVYSKALKRVAEEMENAMLCMYTIVEVDKIYLMQPDFGMFSSDDMFRAIVSELFEEENYEIIYKEY